MWYVDSCQRILVCYLVLIYDLPSSLEAHNNHLAFKDTHQSYFVSLHIVLVYSHYHLDDKSLLFFVPTKPALVDLPDVPRELHLK